MTEESRPAALVRLTDDEMGLVTDADLREHRPGGGPFAR